MYETTFHNTRIVLKADTDNESEAAVLFRPEVLGIQFRF